jgi:hypothetical protein
MQHTSTLLAAQAVAVHRLRSADMCRDVMSRTTQLPFGGILLGGTTRRRPLYYICSAAGGERQRPTHPDQRGREAENIPSETA